MIPLLLTRWRWGIGLFAALALLGAMGAAIHYRGAYRAEKALRAADRALYAATQVEAQAKAYALRKEEATAMTAKAEKGEAKYDQLQERYAALTAAYAAGRVRAKGVASPRGGTVAVSEAGNPGVPEVASPETILVETADLNACSAAVAYGDAAFMWAREVGE